MGDIFKKEANENVEEFIDRLLLNKEDTGYSWNEISDIIRNETGIVRDESSWRKRQLKLKKGIVSTVAGWKSESTQLTPLGNTEELSELFERRIEGMQASDARIQLNALLRRASREDSIKEIAADIASKMSFSKMFPPYSSKKHSDGSGEAVLMLSDWHYGSEISNHWNEFDPDICRTRVAELRDKTIEYCKLHNIKTLYVMQLGDLISGRIHLQLRLNSSIDVVTQVMQVSEILMQLLYDLSEYVHIEYYDCLDNHSRIEPNKKDSVELESLARITTWFLKYSFEDNKNIHINDNIYADDIIICKTKNWCLGGVHGDKDKPNKVVNNITSMTREFLDIVCIAHYHHFSAEEESGVTVVGNGSLMGTDGYAAQLRVHAYASQSLIILGEKRPIECIYKIYLN